LAARALAGAAALLAAAAITGCGGDEERVIDWDFSEGRAVPEEDLDKPDLSANEITPVESVRIRLPGGKIFEAGDEVNRVAVDRDLSDRDRLALVQVMSQPETAEAAYELAVRWAEQFDLPLEPLEAWKRDGDGTARALSADPDATLGPEGPVPAVKLLYSFEDDRPTIAALELAWLGTER
jgi:hypothetical protein